MTLSTGWVPSYRADAFDSIGCNVITYGVWKLIEAYANIEPREITWKNAPRIIPAGAFLMSQRDFARQHGVCRKSLSNALRYLRAKGKITSESGRDGVIIVVQNWQEIYAFNTSRRPSGSQPEANREPIGSQSETIGEPSGSHVYNKRTIRQENQRTREQVTGGVSDQAPGSQNDAVIEAEVIEPQTHQKALGKVKLPRPKKAEPTDGSKVWSAYVEGYRERYGSDPVRNAKTSTQASELVKRLGCESACEVVRFYIRHNDRYYVSKAHPIGLCLADAEGLHTQWQRGRAITSTDAQRADKNQSNAQVFKEVYQELRAKYGD